MTKKGRKANRQLNIRIREEDLKNLGKCQKLLGGISQADAIRQLILMYLGKIPPFPKIEKSETGR